MTSELNERELPLQIVTIHKNCFRVHGLYSLLRSRLSGCHATLPRKELPGGALRDIPKDGCEGDYGLYGWETHRKMLLAAANELKQDWSNNVMNIDCFIGLFYLWEVRLAYWTSITPSTSTTNVVCGLSFSRSQPDFEGFLRALRFPPSSKLTLKFQFDLMQDLPENHLRVSGASWVNIINFYSIIQKTRALPFFIRVLQTVAFGNWYVTI